MTISDETKISKYAFHHCPLEPYLTSHKTFVDEEDYCFNHEKILLYSIDIEIEKADKIFNDKYYLE